MRATAFRGFLAFSVAISFSSAALADGFGDRLLQALGGAVNQTNKDLDAQAQQTAAPGGNSAGNNLSDEFYTNPTAALVLFSTPQRRMFRFDHVELDRGWFRVSFQELPSSVQRLNDQQEAGHGMNNFRALSQGPNGFNSVYTLYCFFPSEDGPKIAQVRIGEMRMVTLTVTKTGPQLLNFSCRL